MASLPAVLSPLTLPALLHHILTTQTSTALTTLVICASRETFLRDLSHSLQNQASQETDSLQDLITPTLHNLSTARHVRVAFCASVQALLAYLTAYGRTETKHNSGEWEGEERLLLVNPLTLHAPTPAFSAQGLSRTFAAAAETASRAGVKLQMVECVGGRRRESHYTSEDEDVDTLMRGEGEGSPPEVEEEDPWEQDVSILNVSVKRFGVWAGRTVKVRRIAGRWFRFQKMDSLRGGEQAE